MSKKTSYQCGIIKESNLVIKSKLNVLTNRRKAFVVSKTTYSIVATFRLYQYLNLIPNNN